MSLGLQGVIGRGFEKRRRLTRMMNIFEYAKQCLKLGIFTFGERVPRFLKKITEHLSNGETVEYTFTNMSKRSVELICQNITGIWGRQVNLWDTCGKHKPETIMTPMVNMTDPAGWTKSDMGDGKLDIYSIKSRFDYAVKQFKGLSKISSLARIGQAENQFSIECTPNSTFHMMVDGEFYRMHDIEKITLKKRGSIKIISSPFKK